MRRAFAPASSEGLTNYFRRSLASIRHRHLFYVSARQCLADAGRNMVRHCTRRLRAFELVWCDQNSHQVGTRRGLPAVAGGVRRWFLKLVGRCGERPYLSSLQLPLQDLSDHLGIRFAPG